MIFTKIRRSAIAIAATFTIAGCVMDTPEQISAMDEIRLCQMYTMSGKQPGSPYLAELMRRKSLTSRDIQDIASETIRTGMKSHVAVCAWGPYQRINSSGGAYGESEQIVISLSQYIYTRNGRVTQWQQ